ncbi:MAG: leucyl/phenylalanyl-tRNA--protein transferase [Planctomycetia bacterium]|nr:leucyl/phenylalanyl-tRNA--protein transferase [Planctomycetia bacterium]
MNWVSIFPHPKTASEEGLLAFSRDINTEMILDAYAHGIFPWPNGENEPIFWWSPHERAIFEMDDFHIPRRLRQTLRSGKFRVTADKAFSRVMEGCAYTYRRGEDGTWITKDIFREYKNLYEMGVAHSVEVWEKEVLVGGVYGVSLGGFFAGESMFFLKRDASKVALAHLMAHLKKRGFTLFDAQITNPHLEQFHILNVSQEEYLERLSAAIALKVSFGEYNGDAEF